MLEVESYQSSLFQDQMVIDFVDCAKYLSSFSTYLREWIQLNRPDGMSWKKTLIKGIGGYEKGNGTSSFLLHFLLVKSTSKEVFCPQAFTGKFHSFYSLLFFSICHCCTILRLIEEREVMYSLLKFAKRLRDKHSAFSMKKAVSYFDVESLFSTI